MKKLTVFRLLIAFGLIIPFAKKIFLISFLNIPEFLEEAQRLAGSPVGTDQLVSFMQKQAIADSLILLSLIPLIYFFILKKLDSKGRFILIYPVAIITSVILGIGLAYLDQYLNPYFMSGYAAVTGQSSSFDLFFRLQTDNAIDILNIFFITGLIYKIEGLLFSSDVSIREILSRTNTGFWIVMSITTIPVLLIIYPRSFISPGQFFLILPQIILVGALSLVVALFFLRSFYERPEFGLKTFLTCFQRTLFPSLGIVSTVLVARTWHYEDSLAFGDFYTGLMLTSVIYILIVCALSYFLFRLDVGGIKNTMLLKLRLNKSSSELNLLKSQVNPHFLFNSLNTLYGIALQEEALKAADGIQKLSNMMRFMLEENTADKIGLSREIEYIHNYIDLQKLRLAPTEKMVLDINIEEPCSGEITPMLIIPFIENAFKHGISFQEKSWIDLHLSCHPEEVSLKIKNSKHAKSGVRDKQGGIGIENVRKRLDILYPDTHLLKIENTESSYSVSLKIPLQ